MFKKKCIIAGLLILASTSLMIFVEYQVQPSWLAWVLDKVIFLVLVWAILQMFWQEITD